MERPRADNISILALDVVRTVVDWHRSIVREVRWMNLDVGPDRFALAWCAGYLPAMQKVSRSSETPYLPGCRYSVNP